MCDLWNSGLDFGCFDFSCSVCFADCLFPGFGLGVQFCDRFDLVFGVRSDLVFGCIGLRLVLIDARDLGIVD